MDTEQLKSASQHIFDGFCFPDEFHFQHCSDWIIHDDESMLSSLVKVKRSETLPKTYNTLFVIKFDSTKIVKADFYMDGILSKWRNEEIIAEVNAKLLLGKILVAISPFHAHTQNIRKL